MWALPKIMAYSLGRRKAILLILAAAALIGAGPEGVVAAENLFPSVLMNWMVEGEFYALIVDKSEQRLHVWRIKDGEPSHVDDFRCSTGENDGDKWVRGDMKTPEGVYFFCSLIDGRTLPSKYGPWAFTTDYPNFVDRRRGKNGDGIWLHGRDKPLGPKPDSNGCVALENADLVKVSRYVRLQNTPLIVVDKVRMAPQSEIAQQEREVRNFIESWRRSWESKNLTTYMEHYSPNFQSAWLDYKGWKEKKRRLRNRYGTVKVKLGAVYIYKHNDIITSIFTQSYGSEGFRSYGLKVLYITDTDKRLIYAEDYHQLVDDQCPAAGFLAKHGVEPAPVLVEKVEKKEFGIRLVSTDEPDAGQEEETAPPVAPEPAPKITLAKVGAPPKTSYNITLAAGEKLIAASAPQRLIVGDAVVLLVADEEADPAGSFTIKVNEQARRVAVALPEEPAPIPVVRVAKRGPIQLAKAIAPPTDVVLTSERIKNEPEIQFNKPASEGSTTENIPSDYELISDFLHKWKTAWEQKDLDRFMKMYHPEFVQGAMRFNALRKSKKNFFRKYRSIHVAIDKVEIKKTDKRTEVRFIQSFQGDEYRDKGKKLLVLDIGQNGTIRILSEDWSPITGIASNSGS